MEIYDYLERASKDITRIIDFGGRVRLSVQASRHHYCDPKISGLPFREYTEFEVAVFDDDGDWITGDDLRRVSVLLSDRAESEVAGTQVVPYVQSDVLQVVFDQLVEDFGEPSIVWE